MKTQNTDDTCKTSSEASSNETSPEEQKTQRRPGKLEIPLLERAAVTPRELGALFGKHESSIYRAIYAGRIKIIHGTSGQILIPRSEIDRLCSAPVVYTGRGKALTSKVA